MKAIKRNKDSWDTSKSDGHKEYTDDEIRLILGYLPTPKNCVILGRVLMRSKGAIRQVFEKAYMPHASVKNLQVGEDRSESKYNQQIQKIAKELKLIKGYNVFQYKGKREKVPN